MKKSLRFFFSGFLTLALFGTAYAQSSLTHSFSFKDGSPTDEVTKQDAELMGDAVIDGNSLYLPGSGSYMDMSAMGIDINTYTALTLEAWATSEEGVNTGYTMICYLGGTTGILGTQGCFISAARGDDFSRGAISTVSLTSPYGANETGVGGPEYDDGVLHNYVLTIDETTLKFYIDGELLGEADLSIVGNSISALSNDFAYLGKGGYTEDPTWIGTIHKFNIYNAALSEEEVAALTVDPNTIVGVKTVNNNFKPSVTSSQNKVNVSLNNTKAINGTTEVFTLSGQKIKSVKFSNSTSIDLSQGMYIVKVSADNKLYTQKVVVR